MWQNVAKLGEILFVSLKFYLIPSTDDRGYEVFGKNIKKQKYPCWESMGGSKQFYYNWYEKNKIFTTSGAYRPMRQCFIFKIVPAG